jgi:hypothetical protein
MCYNNPEHGDEKAARTLFRPAGREEQRLDIDTPLLNLNERSHLEEQLDGHQGDLPGVEISKLSCPNSGHHAETRGLSLIEAEWRRIQESLATDFDCPNHCYGERILCAMFALSKVARIRTCYAVSCLATRQALQAAAPRCQWTRFRDYFLTALGCGLVSSRDLLFIVVILRLVDESLSGRCGQRFSCVDAHGVVDLLKWAYQIFDNNQPPLFRDEFARVNRKLARGYEYRSLSSIQECGNRGICRNRLWNLSFPSPQGILELSHLAEVALGFSQEGNHKDCTEQSCVYSHNNSTLIEQVHKCRPSERNKCIEVWFPPEALSAKYSSSISLVKGVSEFQDIAWECCNDGQAPRLIQNGQRYMAISHVWSDGTGVGLKRPGAANKCLVDFFRSIAADLRCEGIWWDAICVPTGKEERKMAMDSMLDNYERAAVTVVFVEDLVNFEWKEDGSPAVAIVLSAWFTRGWTAAELYASRGRPVKFLFKGRDGPVLKDLDTDILAHKDPDKNEILPAYGYFVAADIIRKFRKGFSKELGLRDLLSLLRGRTTSWAKDRLLIPALMCKPWGFESTSTGPRITQLLASHFRSIPVIDLYHKEIPARRKGPWSWCPPSIFDFASSPDAFGGEQQALFGGLCEISADGTLRGVFKAHELLETDEVTPCASHSAVIVEIDAALSIRRNCLLLKEPGNTDTCNLEYVRECSTLQQYILARTDGSHRRGNQEVIECQWIGCVYFSSLPVIESNIEGDSPRKWHHNGMLCRFGVA